MPFQSEKQRRYLWANEPKIARDWADTYGSRIEKNDGGIMDTKTIKGQPHMLAYITPGEAKDLQKLGGKKTLTAEGIPAYPPGENYSGPTSSDRSKSSDRGGHQKTQAAGKSYEAAKAHSHPKASGQQGGGADQWQKNALKQFANLSSTTSGPSTIVPKEKPKKEASFFTKLKNKHDLKRRKAYVLQYMKKNPAPFYEQTGKGFIWDDWTDEDFLSDTNLQALKDTGYLKGAGSMNQGGGGGIRYPQGIHPGTEVTETEVIEEEGPSKFQQSLTGTVDTPGYYVGGDPTASNLEWGQAYGVDPRTMGRTTWANGGRIPAAFGGIMDSSTGRRGYFLGSIGNIFGSVAKAAKKVFKSDFGKAAMLGVGMFGIPGGSGWTGGLLNSGVMSQGLKNKLFMKNVAEKGMKAKYGSGLSLGKLATWLSPALAFTGLGEVSDDKGEAFDYMGAKNAYAKELLRLKKEANERALDPNEWNYLGVPEGELPFKDGGRTGYYAGGQSTPSDYTMEDAMMTTTQDKLGGITDVMKQADLNRQGSVGQFYAENGGSAEIGEKNISDVLARVKELEDEGLDFAAAMAQAMRELSQGKAQGGRIGADEGGLMDLGGMEKDYRNDGGFVPLGGEEKADDVPARLSKNEFVFTADAVRGAGGGDINKGAEIMENIMKNLEQGGQISEETQGLSGAQEMFDVSERLSEVV